MKTFAMYCLVFFVLIAGQSAFAQTSPVLKDCKTIEDSLRFLKKEFVESDRFIGEPAKELYQACKAILPIGEVIELASSPYIDPEGKSYLKGVTIYYDKHWAEKFYANQPLIVIDINFEDTHMRIIDFRQNVPIGKILDYTGNYIVKKIDIYIFQRGHEPIR